MGVDLQEDLKRKPIELALAAAKSRLSPLTGYVHYCYEDETSRDTIPLFENFCYVLSLFRSRVADHVLEAKELLAKLLAFEVDGNFPIYIHEYPHCRDRTQGLRILPVLHWICKDVLDLKELIERILAHGQRAKAENSLSKSALMKLYACTAPGLIPNWTPETAEEWGEWLVAAQMIESELLCISPKHWNPLIKAVDPLETHACHFWHPQLATFLGRQMQEESEPRLTLYDLFMGHFNASYAKRALEDHPIHLRASLIRMPCSQPEYINIKSTAMVLDKVQPCLYWGDHQQLHSLALSTKKTTVTFKSMEKENDRFLDAQVELFAGIPAEGEESMEFSYFLNIHPDHDITINGAKATAFQLGDIILIRSQDKTLKLQLTLLSGEGKFFGHLLRGNRPMQLCAKGERRFEAHDWQIGLRTLTRTENCVIRATLELLH